MNKIRPFPMDRVLGEIEWFGRNGVAYVEGCIAEGTLVDTIDGAVPIEEIVSGDVVYGFDENDRKIATNIVEYAKYNGIQDVWEIEYEGGSIQATADHPIFTKEGWKNVGDLSPGAEVLFRLWQVDKSLTAATHVLFPQMLWPIRRNEGKVKEGAGRSRSEELGKSYGAEKAGRTLPNVRPTNAEDSAEKVLFYSVLEQLQRKSRENGPGVQRRQIRECSPVTYGGQQLSEKVDPRRKESKSQEINTNLPKTGLLLEQKSRRRCSIRGGQESLVRENAAVLERSEVGSETSREVRSSAQQIRETSDSVFQGQRSTIQVCGGLVFLGRGRQVEWWTQLQSRFHMRKLSGSVARDSCAWKILASRQKRSGGGESGLRKLGVESIDNLGRRSIGSQDGQEGTAFSWRIIKAVRYAGKKKVYDLVNATPNHNFFAGGILVSNCDANFGILPRDVEIAEALAKAKERYGFPERYRAAFAKYSNERIAKQVFDVATILNNSGQLKAVTLALQSTDERVLTDIKRKNISMSGFAELQKKYAEHGIPTYVELIIGLPGETYETFKAGLEKVLDAGGHNALSIYMAILLPNSEMSEPAYVARHGIESVPMRAMLLHGTPNPSCPDEEQITVVATKTMPHEDWRKAWLLSWIVQALHTTGLTQRWAMVQREKGVPYGRFYEYLLRVAEALPHSVLGKARKRAVDLLDGAIAGHSWNDVIPAFGEVSWPTDEGAFLRVVSEREAFYDEMAWDVGMPDELRHGGPPPIPPGREEAYARVFWFNKKGDVVGALKKFCEGRDG